MLGQKQVVSAFNANKTGDFASAANYIDEAITIEKAALKDKTWRYRGEIYLNIAQDSALSLAYPQALWTARDSYKKAQELDVKGNYQRELIQSIDNLSLFGEQQAFKAFKNKEFLAAAELFDFNASIGSILLLEDSTSLPLRWRNPEGFLFENYVNNAGICYEKFGQIQLALERYRTCGDRDFNTPMVYLDIIRLLRDSNLEEEALMELTAARSKYPREQSFIIEELNIYISRKDYDLARSNLRLAIEGDSTNEALWHSLGAILSTIAEEDPEISYAKYEDEIVMAYEKAIEIKPDFFDPNFNLAAHYYNKAAFAKNSTNDLWKPRMSSQEKTILENMEREAQQNFESALIYFKAAHDINPSDIETIRTLRDIYTITKQEELRVEMDALLKTL